MYRGVATALLPCLLLTPSAPLAHSHDCDSPLGHDLFHHFHTNALCVPYHDHAPGAHTDQDDDTDQPGPDEPLSEHDDDAVYLADDVGLPSRVELSGDVETNFSSVSPFNASTESRDGHAPPLTGWPQPPPVAAPADCPLYVRHLVLLL
jgi:hypothetical protein